MPLNNLNLSVSSNERPTDPLEIFRKLTLRGSIENIWDPQAEALREWEKVRPSSDAVVQMNTGGGKTLVGLLIAQSLLNELNRRVAYVVPNNQLVEQTLVKAAEIGMQPASRYKGNWNRKEAFQTAETFCVTNYQSLLTGKSTFMNRDLSAIIFDDAHVAESTIRDQYTLRIDKKNDLYSKVIALYRPHFANTLAANKLSDIAEGNPNVILFVPMFVIWKHATELRKLLIDGGVEGDTNTLFVWDHLSEHLAHCCVLISAARIEISPPVTPIASLPYFQDSVRRIYLTATMPSSAAFARTFGISTPKIVQPGGKSGDAQRLFIFAAGKADKDQRASALALTANQKRCIISPTGNKAKQWSPPSVIFDRDDGHKEINDFCDDPNPATLGLVARYDGIDLPGDSCRVLILDRLPHGEALFDKFADEGSRVDTIRLGQTATRIVQAIGRIFRSNTDHGAVIIAGRDLQDWLRNPSNRSYLPAILQKQIALAIELGKKVEAKEVTTPELLNGVLTGDADWDALYRHYIDQFPTAAKNTTDEWYPQMVVRERNAYQKIWEGNYGQAITILSELANDAGSRDMNLAAWYKHLEGVAHLCAEDRATAIHAFAEAARTRVSLGRPSEKRDKLYKHASYENVGFQATKLATAYRKDRTKLLSAVERVIADLQYGPETDKAEDSIRMLGSLLGLNSTRPEKDSKSGGPDNLWQGDGAIDAWSFDLKTGKKPTSEYTKDEVGKAYVHAQWVKDNIKPANVKHSIVGRQLSVSNLASPSPELEVIDFSGFMDLAESVKCLLESIEAGDKSNLEDAFENWLRHYGLLWPNCVLALPSRRAVELKAD